MSERLQHFYSRMVPCVVVSTSPERAVELVNLHLATQGRTEHIQTRDLDEVDEQYEQVILL